TPHDSHAELAARALRAGKHVFCEKPLALTMEELDDVEAAWKESGRVLFVGFNRRYSEAVAKVREHFAGGTGPLVITYRVNAGPIPKGHWYNDRRQGGRLLGEVCHFIDTCDAIVGSDALDVIGLGSGPLDDDVILGLRYPDGSLATISYSSAGHSSTEKERIEILGRGRSATVVDFTALVLDGSKVALTRTDKGHQAEIRLFREALSTGMGDCLLTASTRASLRAVASLVGTGET
ncbi:MAG: hypothetical protein QOG43_472, partial [Actinomycetota bacterium]|nr:hypothetical protein [Actinomycetota bacterium]